jgi:hypothetical protein
MDARTASIIVNGAIFLATFVLLTLNFRKEGQWQPRRGLKSFRYFTVLSNAFCAVTALVMAIAQLANRVAMPVVLLKYMGTVSVSVTLLTVMLFLGPTQGYGEMLRGRNLYMHLVGPLLAIVSYCLWEKRPMSFGMALTGLIPVLVYGLVYLNQVILAPEARRWDDFYGFNRGGKWPVAFAAMLLGTFLLCVVIRWLYGL